MSTDTGTKATMTFRTPKASVAADFLALGDFTRNQAIAALDLATAIGEITVGTTIIGYNDGRYVIQL